MIPKSYYSCRVAIEDQRADALVNRDDITMVVYEREGLNIVLKCGAEIRVPDTTIEELWQDFQPEIEESMRWA